MSSKSCTPIYTAQGAQCNTSTILYTSYFSKGVTHPLPPPPLHPPSKKLLKLREDRPWCCVGRSLIHHVRLVHFGLLRAAHGLHPSPAVRLDFGKQPNQLACVQPCCKNQPACCTLQPRAAGTSPKVTSRTRLMFLSMRSCRSIIV